MEIAVESLSGTAAPADTPAVSRIHAFTRSALSESARPAGQMRWTHQAAFSVRSRLSSSRIVGFSIPGLGESEMESGWDEAEDCRRVIGRSVTRFTPRLRTGSWRPLERTRRQGSVLAGATRVGGEVVVTAAQGSPELERRAPS